jgi:hypothetical protein
MNYLLSNTNDWNWRIIDINFIKSKIENKLSSLGCLYGELEPENTLDISFTRVSHVIKNVTFHNGEIYGDVTFLNNMRGKLAKKCVEELDYYFQARTFYDNNGVNIITWDIVNYAPFRRELRDSKIDEILNQSS